ncbi:MAG TPA: hypothetical protein VF627_00280 [Abditibacterium sp.]
MKRKLAWLVLPFLLAALIFGVKWRVDHPSPTKEDLELRAWLSTASTVTIHHLPGATLQGNKYIYKGKSKSYVLTPSEAQLESLVDAFYLLPEPFKDGPMTVGGKGHIIVGFSLLKPGADGVSSAGMSINLDGLFGQYIIVHHEDINVKRRLHPATVKRWVAILLSNPNIGTELRARMKR